ncbi:Germinal-center associated nuclear protein [Liparis tanakae]|uniref:Germinal-center associated nuclear protein n=1 Tax=Liparis tanakae TaxID=230148 RepID=A0A4Z2HSD1_9TELE|nr:Germinal-center associated nuclear protein [Liparis tanakae]
MNPSNPFGSPQSGAFQAPSNAAKTGLFPSFGQQSSGIRPQSVGFFAPSAFGQPSVLSQPSSAMFGQPAQPTSTPATSQAPAFGQPSVGMSSTGFGSSSAPAFGQTAEPDHGSGFGQTPSFAQPSAFGQPPGYSQPASGFVKQPPAFGQQPSGFAAPQMAPVPTAALGQPQPLSFGQSVFGQPSSTGVPAGVFGTAPGVTPSGGFGSSGYSFKPANEAVFKPILNVSPEPAHPQTTAMSGSPFGSGGSQAASSTAASGFSGAPAGQLGFSFSQPGAAPSISAQPNKVTKETDPQGSTWEEPESENVHDQGPDVAATPPTGQPLPREGLDTAEPSDSTPAPASNPGTATPERRRKSSESLGGMCAADCTAIQCRNVPPSLNKKDLIEKHFERFGKVSKVFCRPAKNLAIVHFNDHASAARAKKKGKHLHRHELFLSWQKKKQSPDEKGSRSAAEKEAEGGSQEDTGSKSVSSPLRKPALSSLMAFSRSSPVKKSSIAKSLQFDSEPQSSERPVPSSLLHLLGLTPETAEDKFRLLEQRDKILRQGRPKRTDLDLSKVFVGTCPDMCPEKERYMRETRKQLSVFEVFPDTEMVDHSAAIKEYSRSSADQEEPLPHELRPLPVLSMTMDYLVTQILDQGHDNYRDWYDLVWNRTRAIRKDITQQHLCCPLTVSLIEKCTRFHVHCAHHLCEERLSTFDAKINNENMTKCLQSLKEMYQDLAMRQVYCPLEAEFRQYSVLLRLNDGDILREVEQYREEVRNSPEVKLAVQAFTAVNSNNFVRFFKLVKSASYLASCLLHRYFNQVRAKALSILNIAHTVGPRSTAFPVDDIVRMLMFRSAEETSDFVQQYGLNVNDGLVELSRLAHQEPDLPLAHKKSEVILAKKTVLIGEVVHGGALPVPRHHTPVCSFDAQNRYRGEGPLAESTPSPFKAFAAKVEVKVPQPAADAPAGFGSPPAVTREPAESREPFGGPEVAQQQQLFQPTPQPVRPPSPPPKPRPVYSNEVGGAPRLFISDVRRVDWVMEERWWEGAEHMSCSLGTRLFNLSISSEVFFTLQTSLHLL